MVEAQRIRMSSSWLVQLYFTANSETFVTPATDFLGGPFYPSSRVIDLAEYPIPEGLVFTPTATVSGVPAWGKPPPPPPPITFKMNGKTANYQVGGTTSAWTITYENLDPPSGRPDLPGFPADVPLFDLPFKNWDWQIQAPAVATCAPRCAADTAAVCNWASQNGYKVRPRGVMHGWSPLTLPTAPIDGAKILLIDLTKSLWQTTFLPASGGLPNRVKAGAGATMLQLLQFLEAQPGGKGAAPGYSFPHTPAPGNLTLGGVLAIGAHGTAVRTPPIDDLPGSYGSMSNQVLEFTAICTDPVSANPNEYVVRQFKRGDPDAKALLVNLGRTLIIDATLQVVDNYNLRCESRTDIPSATLFAAPTTVQPIPPNSFAEFFERTGRIEIIWFPYGEQPPLPGLPLVHPWLHVWTTAPEKPARSIPVKTPYNYPFADHVSDALQTFLKQILTVPSVTPVFGYTAATITADGLKNSGSQDIWGPSKNTLLYVQDTTLRVTANGYAVHLRRGDLQQAVADLTGKFSSLLASYAARSPAQYPINSPVEIRVTGLDDPNEVQISPKPESPSLSASGLYSTDAQRHWDIALWFDVLTIPQTPHSNEFYHDLEKWLVERFADAAARTMPEWSKGWAYSANQGAWTDPGFLKHVREMLTVDGNWAFALETFAKYDKSHLFSSPFLDRLFQPE